VERLARLVMRHRLIVSLFWLVTFVLGGIAAGQLSDRLTLDFSLPGQPGDNAENQLIESYGASSFDTYVVVVTVPDGQTVDGPTGTLLHFQPDERHSVRSDAGARLLIMLAPWPGEGHYWEGEAAG